MPCAKLTRVAGIVAAVIDGSQFAVRLSDGTALTAHISRRLARLQKGYAVGDAVQVGVLAHRRGLILTNGDRATAAGATPGPAARHKQ